MSTASQIWFCGDVHGEFGHVFKAAENTPSHERPAAVIFLGDLDPPEPLSRIFSAFLNVGIEPWFIHGNHEVDHSDTWANTLDCWERNLHGRVETIAGVRIAGLGGVFLRDIWMPPELPKVRCYDEFVRQRHGITTTVARIASAGIFPDVLETLSLQKADVLATHEGPICNPLGFRVIDEVARAMGVKVLFHGHHHTDLSYGNELGFDAYQVGLRGIRELSGGLVKRGDSE